MRRCVRAPGRFLCTTVAVLVVWILCAGRAEAQEFGDQFPITTSADSVESVDMADLDGDGDQDVLVAAGGDDTVAWYENLSGEFGAQHVITEAADDVVAVSASDLDGDGDQDVLFASIGDNNRLAWVENTGGGSFANETVIDRNGTQGVHIADLDGDADQDIVVADLAFDEVKWYENTGGGSFSDRKLIDDGAERARSVLATDLDGDGDTDIVGAALDGDNVVWYENTGDGVFSSPNVITSNANGARSIYATDLDLDGDPDVLSASSFDDKIAWYENTGGSFSSQRVITTDISGASFVHGIDVDGDGDEDVVSGSYSGTLAWYETFPGEFGSQQIISTNTDWVTSLSSGDVDGDHDSELISGSRDDDKVAWYPNLGSDGIAPSAPTGVQAEAGQERVDLNWDENAETDLAGYNVYRSTSSFLERANATKVNGSVLESASYTDSDVTAGTEYFYRVTAVDGSGNESSLSNEGNATPQEDTPPSAPTGLAATAGDGQVDLGWDANTEGDLAGYHVYRSTSSFQEVANGTRLNDLPVGAASFTDTGVSNGTQYYYRVTAVDTSGNESTGSNEASATPQAQSAPSAPTELQATDSNSQVLLGWNANSESDLAGYNVYRSTSSFQEVANAEKLNQELVETSSYGDTSAVNDTEYFYRVTAVDSSGAESAPSSQVSAIPRPPPVAQTEEATDVTSSSAVLHGQVDPNGQETTVIFEYYPTGQEGESQGVLAQESPLTGTEPQAVSATITGLTSNTEYTFFVHASSNSGGDTGAAQTLTTTSSSISAPTGLAATAGDSQVDLGWDANTEGDLAGYHVYRSTSSFQEIANATQISSSLVETESFTDTGVSNGTQYHYRVTAVDTSGNESAGSNEASATPQAQSAPSAPTELQATASNSQVLLGWNANSESDLAGYNVYRSTSSFQEVANAAKLNQELVEISSYGDTSAVNDTEYFYRVTAVDSSGAEGGPSSQVSAIPRPPPVAQTEEATDVTSSSAVLHGQVDPNGQETTVIFEYYPTGQEDESQGVLAQETPLTGTEPQAVSATITGLTSNTEYTFFVHASSNSGGDTGAAQTLTTTSSSISAPTGLQATAGDGQVDLGWDANTETDLAGYHVYRSTSSFQEVANATQISSSLVENESFTDTEVSNGTEYFYRVTAVDDASNESEPSNEANAIPAGAPVAETGNATEITDSSAQLTGQVRPGGTETTAVFEYYPTGEPGESQTVNAAESPLNGGGQRSVSAQVSDLTPNTEYTVQLSAENTHGSDEGGTQSFATEAVPPTAETGTATNITFGAAQLNGTVDPNGSETSVIFEYRNSDSGDSQTVRATESPITGDTPQSVSASVSGLQPETQYAVEVVASNAAGNQRGQTRTFTTEALSIALAHSPEVPERGIGFSVTATLPEGFSPTEDAELYYRRAGAQAFQMTTLSSVNATTYEGTVPGSAVTERGVEYYARFSDGTLTETVPASEPSSQPLFASVRVPEMQAGVGLAADQYRMISVPLRLDPADAFAQLQDDFGPLDRSVWRLLRWDPGTGEYDEVTTENGSGDLRPGRAFWLITQSGETQDGQSTFDVTDGRSVLPGPFQIELPPGWSQVGNPRPYPVAWTDVVGSESVMAPVSYDPSAPDSADFDVERLQPWAGYWVFNPSGSPVQLSVPSTEADGTQADMLTTNGGARDAQSLFGEKPGYAVAITARMEREGQSPLRDAHTVMAVGEAGRSGVGVEDVAEPPPIDEHLRVSIVEETTRLAGSLRPTGQEGYEWDLEVSASDVRGSSRVHGTLEVRGSLPPGFERRLMDVETGRRIPITDGTFTLQLSDERPTRHLRLVVGTEGYAEAKTETIRPDETGLRAVYPNPARGNVSVDYQLKTAQRVQIRIYDLLGRRVETLVSGRRPQGHHTVRWNTRSGTTPVASGTYILRMNTESASVSQRISIVR